MILCWPAVSVSAVMMAALSVFRSSCLLFFPSSESLYQSLLLNKTTSVTSHADDEYESSSDGDHSSDSVNSSPSETFSTDSQLAAHHRL